MPLVRHVHRKVFLPTYGLFDEERFVERGRDIRAFDTPWGRAAILVCEDAWHSLSGTIAALDGAQLIFVPSAPPARGAWPQDGRGARPGQRRRAGSGSRATSPTSTGCTSRWPTSSGSEAGQAVPRLRDAGRTEGRRARARAGVGRGDRHGDDRPGATSRARARTCRSSPTSRRCCRTCATRSPSSTRERRTCSRTTAWRRWPNRWALRHRSRSAPERAKADAERATGRSVCVVRAGAAERPPAARDRRARWSRAGSCTSSATRWAGAASGRWSSASRGASIPP